MKTILKIFVLIWIISSLFIWFNVDAWVELKPIETTNIENVSIKTIKSTWDIAQDISDTWMSILKVIKLIFEWVLIIYIVYAWIQMIISMWTDEDALTKSKTSIRYSIIWLVFINIPWTLFNAFRQDNYWKIDWSIWYSSFANTPSSGSNNILINTFNFWETLNWDIVWFIEVWLSAITIIIIIIAWIKLIMSRWREEEITKARKRITWAVIWLVFIWFIETWKSVIFSWDIEDGANLFQTASNLALFFAWPVAIFFLTIAAYYYITSNGDEEKTKKAKSIVVNTVIATVILLASYTFLLDLATL